MKNFIKTLEKVYLIVFLLWKDVNHSDFIKVVEVYQSFLESIKIFEILSNLYVILSKFLRLDQSFREFDQHFKKDVTHINQVEANRTNHATQNRPAIFLL